MKALAILVVTAGLLLAGGEAALRWKGYSEPVLFQPDARLGWRLRANLPEVSSEGVRDREHMPAKPKNVYRIVVLGDEFAEARGLERDQTLWDRLPEQLSSCEFRPGTRIEVLNFAVAGYGTAQEYLMLESSALHYRPDLVLLLFAHGDDVRNNSFALEPRKERPFFMLERDGSLAIDASFVNTPGFRAKSAFRSEVARRLADRSRLVQFVYQRPLFPQAVAADAFDAEALQEPRDALWEEAWRITEGLLAQTADFARRNGSQFALVSVPPAREAGPYSERRIAAFAKKSGVLSIALGNREHDAAASVIARRLCAAGI